MTRRFRVVAIVETPEKLVPLIPGGWGIMRQDEEVTITEVTPIMSAEDALSEIEKVSHGDKDVYILLQKIDRIIADWRASQEPS